MKTLDFHSFDGVKLTYIDSVYKTKCKKVQCLISNQGTFTVLIHYINTGGICICDFVCKMVFFSPNQVCMGEVNKAQYQLIGTQSSFHYGFNKESHTPKLVYTNKE